MLYRVRVKFKYVRPGGRLPQQTSRLVLVRDQSEILAIQEAQKRVNGTITEIVGIDWL